ncbi:metallophosphoesterase family protein [Saccharicrinis fermentans]|uniref:Bis(5'-nucleosyl)-tetraphosphatase PrpE n=1 Tax=Saccharicrinis fermentans DSM 9555 = JCM 21142 TaxID=869213 RepID=W7YU69_9BACT|nr:metallophosphoesterase family protein [Saccharicrinis fermentans]GAF06004.1 bis(5'-nucleosyl)-tetraphosphatase PrpE [Saccharicrinis fermentans DSM 9555 = JCM 21142]
MKRLFALGDIHGCFDSLKELVENKIQLNKGDKLILLGDYIDRGNKSKEVVDYIIDLQEKGFDIIPLLGNHEMLLLETLEDEKNLSKWIQNGGVKTLKNFNIESVNDISPKYLEFFKNLQNYYSFEEFLFVHAGCNDKVVNPFQDTYSMLWKSQATYTSPLLTNKIIVHGHRPISIELCIKQFDENKQVINIDTGCVYKEKVGYGKLTSIELYSKMLFSV